MTLRLNGSSSGFTEIDAPAAAGSNTLTLPTSSGSAFQSLRNGSTAGSLVFADTAILQVVHAETQTEVDLGQLALLPDEKQQESELIKPTTH